VTTRADSTPAGVPYETYEIDEHVTSMNFIGASDPDSGYSVDNLAPPTPSGFAGNYAAGSAQLVWDPSLAADLATYRLYRGSTPLFVPGPSNRIASPTTTHYLDAPGLPYYYKLTALDTHGNESPPSTLLPAGTTAADADALPTEVALSRPRPDPARVASRVRFALPSPGPVRLTVFDAAGRQVRSLANGVFAAGMHDAVWDLLDDGGRPVSPGLYFVRLGAAGRTLIQRLVALR
jgi:hypothetical protein